MGTLPSRFNASNPEESEHVRKILPLILISAYSVFSSAILRSPVSFCGIHLIHSYSLSI